MGWGVCCAEEGVCLLLVWQKQDGEEGRRDDTTEKASVCSGCVGVRHVGDGKAGVMAITPDTAGAVTPRWVRK